MLSRRARALGLCLGYVADRLFTDPARWHPVAGFGRLACALEQRTYADHRGAGVAHVAVLVGAVVAAGAGWQRAAATRTSPTGSPGRSTRLVK